MRTLLHAPVSEPTGDIARIQMALRPMDTTKSAMLDKRPMFF